MDTAENVNIQPDVKKPLVFDINQDDTTLTQDEERNFRPTDNQGDALSAWKKVIILTGSCYNTFVCSGFPMSLSVLYVELLDVFSTTRRETSLIQSVMIGCSFGLCLLSGVLIEVKGTKCGLLLGSALGSISLFLAWFATSVPYLIVTIGLVGGLSNSLIFMSTNVLVATAFKERRNLALTIIGVAIGIGQSVLPPVLAALQDCYGWRGCFLISTGLFLNVAVSTMLITSSLGFPLPFIKKGFMKRQSETKWTKLLNPIYICVMPAGAVALTSTSNVFVAVLDLLRSKGISEETGLSLIVIFSCVGLFLRLVVGSLSQIKVFHSLLLFSICSTLAGCSLITVANTNNFIVIVIFLCLVWGAHGGIISINAIMMVAVTSVDVIAISLGIYLMMIGIMTPIGSAIMGWLFDTRRSYELSFLIYGGLCVVSGLLAFVLFLFHRRSTQKEKTIRNS